jgi:hypothetical protein
MAVEKILITVKTYPSLSAKYDELVCTAGFREDGSWIRIYPVQFRNKPYDQQYKKYEWIEVDLVKNKSDFRPESYRPATHETEFSIVGAIPADGNDWHERRKYALNKVYTDLSVLKAEAKETSLLTSLATFKPTKITAFKIERVEREWKKEKLEALKQLNLFDSNPEGKLNVVKKLPYKFSYSIEDIHGVPSTMMIEDWEIGQLFWNSLARHNGDENQACMDVEKKYFNDFAKTKDLHLFLGTTLAHHNTAPNPFVIIGTFHPKRIIQQSLF